MTKFIDKLKEQKEFVIATGKSLINPKYLDLFDLNGICVIEQAPFLIDDKNILSVGNSPEWKQPVYQRVKKIVDRDKNHPCIIKFKMDEILKEQILKPLEKLSRIDISKSIENLKYIFCILSKKFIFASPL